MNTAAIYALCFAAAVVVLAVLATRLTKRLKRPRYDLNESGKDGQGVATWIGVHAARDEGSPDN
jgi:membrane protein implicated in regulation of membrane protease activity